MAAPTKEGLDYFSFDVDLLDNDDLDFLREQYGVVVNDVYIALLTLLYRKKGYYIPYTTDAEQKDCIWYIYKRVRGGKYPVQQGLIPIVIEALVAQGLFDSTMFNQNDHTAKIITSERAQKTYYKATVERKSESFNIIPEYWLLDDETMRKLSKTHPYYLSLHPESKSDEKWSKSDEKWSKSDEKPLKESKVNNTSNEVYNIPPYSAGAGAREGIAEALQGFCERFNIAVDGYDATLQDIDFGKLTERYESSKTFLQDKPPAKSLKWICKNYTAILAGKYDDFEDKPASKKATAHERGTDILKGVFDSLKHGDDE